MKKVNKRKKASFGIAEGIALASALIGAATGIGGAINNYNTRVKNQKNATLAGNFDNSSAFIENERQGMNYEQNNEIPLNKTNYVPTLTSAMKCGGKKRMKRAGGTVVSDLHKIGLYI